MKILILIFSVIFLSCSSDSNLSGLIKKHESLIDQNRSLITLYYFFTSIDCYECLEGGEVLEEIKDGFNVIGVIDSREESMLPLYRKKFGFPVILKDKSFKGIIPLLTPAIVGVSLNGDFLFNIPYTENMREYLKLTLYSISLRIRRD